MITHASLENQALSFLENLFHQLEKQAPVDWDLDFDGRSLTIEISDSAVFLVNFHQPTEQIWLSSPVTGAHHFAYDHHWLSTRTHASFIATLLPDLQTFSPTLVLNVEMY